MSRKEGVNLEAGLDLGFVLESLIYWVADSNKHFLNTYRKESRLTSSKKVVDEKPGYFSIFIQINVWVKKPTKQTNKNPARETK